MPQISEEELKRIRKIELAVNNNLFLICGIITFIAMAMTITQFFTRGAFPHPGLNFFYVGILFIYSIHKEMLRWVEEKKVERQGEWFVYSWIGLTIILFIINFLTKDYFSYSLEGAPIEALRDSAATTLEVCAIFILTRLSKAIKIITEKK